MQVKNVDFLLTFKCPAKCQHCSYKSGPDRVGFIRPKESSGYLKGLTKMHPLQSVWVHGGEPFLYFNSLEYIIKEARNLDIPRLGVITNSFWAKNDVFAKKKLEKLKKVGLTVLTFSSDFFHQEFIPLKYVKNALKAATALGFEKIYVDSYFVDNVSADNYFNQITKKNLEILGDIEGVEFHRFPMSVEGRGTDLTEYLNLMAEIPTGNCPVPFWIEGHLQNPATIEIDCEGNVTLCPGICIGNTKIQSLTKILQDYDVDKHPILSIVSKEGPIGLIKLANEQGFQKNQRFVNECHLCYELRKSVQLLYPYSLAPEYCY
ncbi:MAG: radical SAM protein [Candidatus Lokiarchaeota archaeon]|nr:radical SAM protein [Candidatus Lokiarchaeota archaeon]